MKKLYLFILLAVFLLGFFLRFYHLSDLPNGLNQDETALGYNAYLIGQTGKDEYGHVMPLYFKSFGDYKLPVYIYLTVVSEKVFGLNAFAVRFWSALLGSLTIVLVFFLVRLVMQSEKAFWTSQNDKNFSLRSKNNSSTSFDFTQHHNMIPLIASLLLTINPWHLFFSRVAFEVNVANFFLTLGVFLFILSVQKKQWFWIIIAIVSFGISLYSYNVTRLIAPVLLGFLIFSYWHEIKKVSILWKSLWSVVFLAFFLPFILTLFSHSGLSMQKNVLIIGGESQANILAFRSYLSVLPSIFAKLFFNNFLLWIWTYIRNMIGFFSPTFFFLSGGSFSVSVGNVGMFYPFEAISIVVGLFLSLQKKQLFLRLFLGWFVIVLSIISLSTNAPHATRDFTMIVPLTVFSSVGLFVIFRWIQQQHRFVRHILYGTAFPLICYSLIYFAISYILPFPILSAKTWRTEDKPLAFFLQQESQAKTVFIDSDTDFIYTSLVFYQQYPASAFLATEQHEPDSLFIHLQKVGKYHFGKIDWTKAAKMQHTLFVVTASTNVPSSLQKIAMFFYPTRHIVLPLDTMYAQYPVTDVAYVVYATRE